jgi:hypothetical protein
MKIKLKESNVWEKKGIGMYFDENRWGQLKGGIKMCWEILPNN